MAAFFPDDIFKYIFLNKNVWIHLIMFLRVLLTMSQHSFRYRVGGKIILSNKYCNLCDKGYISAQIALQNNTIDVINTSAACII